MQGVCSTCSGRKAGHPHPWRKGKWGRLQAAYSTDKFSTSRASCLQRVGFGERWLRRRHGRGAAQVIISVSL